MESQMAVFKQIDDMERQGLINSANASQAKWRIALGSEAAAAMFPKEPNFEEEYGNIVMQKSRLESEQKPFAMMPSGKTTKKLVGRKPYSVTTAFGGAAGFTSQYERGETPAGFTLAAKFIIVATITLYILMLICLIIYLIHNLILIRPTKYICGFIAQELKRFLRGI
jgi:hypothetical protein